MSQSVIIHLLFLALISVKNVASEEKCDLAFDHSDQCGKSPAKETTFIGNNNNGKLWFTCLLQEQTLHESSTAKFWVTVAEKDTITEDLQVKWYRRGNAYN